MSTCDNSDVLDELQRAEDYRKWKLKQDGVVVVKRNNSLAIRVLSEEIEHRKQIYEDEVAKLQPILDEIEQLEESLKQIKQG